ncbi:MAG: hypothetical protein ABFC96_05670 [Thermoguttaceae bacterium]
MDAKFLPENVSFRLFPWRRARTADQAGGEIARQCRADLWRRLRPVADGMSPAELRGYARAQATSLVEFEADRLLERHCLRTSMRDRVLAAGIDQVVTMAVRDVLSDPLPIARAIAA